LRRRRFKDVQPDQAGETFRANADDRLEAMLDEALAATFPASDPISITLQRMESKP
jgi:hypothetical protein